ncbi:MoaD/ThiS family protein [Cerasicoccus arenae]|uniref:Molybdopterin synthase sulfur carrier subunit n=1 Tax=Cerasicoccus arenae TaxID=424488 RepID=A0A8J3GE40_9BACT|nr:MoaD/ThiS family protein [Cerasicoccus arenae]MBK1857253.1 MoaD/ThiS family protein [Cerasicoccus arenae]GHC00294.1 hypothetical protein GCM10007047_15730 [Cerasicoccus arenae]
MKSVTMLYFAQLSAQAGCAEERWETDVSSLQELFAELKQQHTWTLSLNKVRFARNDAFCAADESFDDGDVLAIMPPMSGG